MIPIGDVLPRRRFPYMTYLLITLNVVAFFYEISLGPNALENFVFSWGAIPARLENWDAHPIVLFSLITSIFLHGGWIHLISNMLYLWVFGDNVEDRLGHFRYLLFYLVGGITAGLAQAWFAAGSQLPAVGASGAVAAILGAYMVMFPGAQVLVAVPILFFLPFTVPSILVLGLWFIGQLFNGLFALSVSAAYAGGVAWWAHIGGFLLGMIIAGIFGGRPPRRPRPSATYSAIIVKPGLDR